MRVENWNPNAMDETFEHVALERLVAAARIMADAARSRCPVGTITRPMYKSGKYAGRNWTSRDAGRLKKSIRVVTKRTKSGKAFSSKRNVRIYAGHFLAWYADIVEFYTPYMRPALSGSIDSMREALGAEASPRSIVWPSGNSGGSLAAYAAAKGRSW